MRAAHVLFLHGDRLLRGIELQIGRRDVRRDAQFLIAHFDLGVTLIHARLFDLLLAAETVEDRQRKRRAQAVRVAREIEGYLPCESRIACSSAGVKAMP